MSFRANPTAYTDTKSDPLLVTHRLPFYMTKPRVPSSILLEILDTYFLLFIRELMLEKEELGRQQPERTSYFAAINLQRIVPDTLCPTKLVCCRN